MRPVARIDDARSEAFGEKLRRPGRTVPQDDDVDVVCLENFCSVFEGFAFCQAGGCRRNIDNVRAQANRSDLERGARPRARLNEEIHQRLASQGRNLFDLPRAYFFEGIRRIENEGRFPPRKARGCRARSFRCQRISDLDCSVMLHSSFTSQTASGSPSTF